MKAATIHELKQELTVTPPAKLLELCVRLAKYKKENKELLTFLLFEAHDETAYINSVKNEMEEQFGTINKSNIYFAKKSIRKILRMASKYIRYSGSKQVEAELLITFCKMLIQSGISFRKNTALNNLYHSQLKKINKVVSSMHEDLQYEYLRSLKALE